jgi:hypothetical protein
VKTSDTNPLGLFPKKLPGFIAPDQANSSSVVFQIDDLWRTRFHRTNSTQELPELLHHPVIQKDNVNGFTVPAAGHPSHHPSNWWFWRTRSTGLTSSRKEVSHKEKIPNNPCLYARQSFNPPNSLSLLKLANQIHRTQVI